MSTSNTKRPPEPLAVKQWRDSVPRCCHTCLYYDTWGVCQAFRQRPPEEFAAQIGACPKWEWEIIPF